MKRALAATALVIGLLPLTAGPVAADTGSNGAALVTAQRGFLCEAGISCPSVYHTRRGVHRRIKINCGTYENPGGNRRLARGQSSKDPGKCGKKTNAVYVPAGFDTAYCGREWGVLICHPWRKSTGWHYLGDFAQSNLRIHVIHNGVCPQQCGPDVS